MYDGLYLVSIACVWPNINKVRLYSERLAAACRQMQTNADECRCMQTHADKHKANCVQCVGGHKCKTHTDVTRLFKVFLDAL